MPKTLKMGIFTLPYADSTVFDGPRHVRSLGLNAYEPFASGPLAGPDMEAGEKLFSLAQAEGVAIPCVSVGAYLCGERAEAGEARLKDFADLCAHIHVPYLHHTLFPAFRPELRNEPYEKYLNEAVPRLRRVFDYAEKRGIRCIYENQGFVFNGAERMTKLFQTLDRPAGAVLDLGNIAFADERADDYVRVLAERAVHVHVKDYAFTAGLHPKGYVLGERFIVPTPLGHGSIGACEALTFLRDAGYQGWYMLEHTTVSDPDGEEKECLDKLADILSV